MSKTVLITGSSTGIGRATAYYFQSKGWNVAATLRSPEKETELTGYRNVFCTALDVTRGETIEKALHDVLHRFGAIDVVVNNAGYSLTGPFELMTEDQIKAQFETNVFGTMAVIRSVLPYFRARKAGILINVASMGGRVSFPLYSPYHASKWAIEGFSESLQYELSPFNIRVKIVEPGAIKTDFYSRSADSAHPGGEEAYDEFTLKAMSVMQQMGERGAKPERVARAIFRAATDNKRKLRYPVGLDAHLLLLLRRWLPDALFRRLVQLAVLR